MKSLKHIVLAFLVVYTALVVLCLGVISIRTTGMKRVYIPEDKWQTTREFENIETPVECHGMTVDNGENFFYYDKVNKICRLGIKDASAEETRYPGAGLISIWKPFQVSGQAPLPTTTPTTTTPTTTTPTTTVAPGPLNPNAEYTKLMVMGGLSASYDTEVINLSDDGKTCDKPFNSPVKESGVGIYFDGFPLICGGIVGSALSSACYRYNAQTNSWNLWSNLMAQRLAASSCLITADKWWVAGGHDHLTSSETVEAGSSTFQSFATLPTGMMFQTTIRVNESFIFVSFKNKKSWLLDVDPQVFNPLPDMLNAREKANGGLVEDSNGKRKVIVAGGVNTFLVDILDLDTLEWSAGPSLPWVISGGASVPYKRTFLIVGGFSNTNLGSIVEFDVENNDWVVRSESLQSVRSHANAFLVPDSALTCN